VAVGSTIWLRGSGYAEAVKLAREFGVLVLEDEAHAMLSGPVGGIWGRLGDALYLLHTQNVTGGVRRCSRDQPFGVLLAQYARRRTGWAAARRFDYMNCRQAQSKKHDME